ncbi:hypothetical protein EYF80_040379 [Liparis tanakae]|uniref:Uncharacterized protein n=1 Tax=Liparis tanakae TaxID=230148 RepID=A0A4Z2G9C2_9TELE|nr:hypothetical protein EYF80_040379 [Liparis tanakae]
MLRRTLPGSLRRHLCSSSCILSTLAGLSAQRQPLRGALCGRPSTFWKHLFRDRLWRTEFFQPSGADWKKKHNTCGVLEDEVKMSESSLAAHVASMHQSPQSNHLSTQVKTSQLNVNMTGHVQGPLVTLAQLGKVSSWNMGMPHVLMAMLMVMTPTKFRINPVLA